MIHGENGGMSTQPRVNISQPMGDFEDTELFEEEEQEERLNTQKSLGLLNSRNITVGEEKTSHTTPTICSPSAASGTERVALSPKSPLFWNQRVI